MKLEGNIKVLNRKKNLQSLKQQEHLPSLVLTCAPSSVHSHVARTLKMTGKKKKENKTIITIFCHLQGKIGKNPFHNII